MKLSFIFMLGLILLMKINTNTLAQNTEYINEKNSAFNSRKPEPEGNKAIGYQNIIIDGFYGWPYFNGVLLSGIAAGNYKTKNTNHLGGKIEYMITDVVGLGGEFTYADASIRYQDANTGIYYDAGITKMRILGRFNYHFATTKNVDPYCSFGAGYKRTIYYDNGNGGIDETFNFFPVSMKMAIGARIYFSDLIGFNAEFGFGGPLLSAGFSIKF